MRGFFTNRKKILKKTKKKFFYSKIPLIFELQKQTKKTMKKQTTAENHKNLAKQLIRYEALKLRPNSLNAWDEQNGCTRYCIAAQLKMWMQTKEVTEQDIAYIREAAVKLYNERCMNKNDMKAYQLPFETLKEIYA